MDDRTTLTQSLSTLRSRRSAFRHHATRLVPDLTLTGFLDGLLGAADAVLELVDRGKPNLAYPNARAAFEFAQNVLMLVTSDDYDVAGSHAYLYFTRLDYSIVENARKRAQPESTNGDDESATYEKAVQEMRANWAAFSPGKEKVFDKAVATLRSPQLRPYNWAGVNFGDVLPGRMEKIVPPEAGIEPIEDARGLMKHTYAVLARTAHCHLELRLRGLRGKPGGFVAPEVGAVVTDEVAEQTLSVTNASVCFGILALAVRGHIRNE